MKKALFGLDGLTFGMACLLAASGLPAQASRTWVASTDGLWRDTNNWSGFVLPDAFSSVSINNAINKTITIDALTAAANLTVPKLTLSAPAGYTNTLYLNSVTNGPLTCTVGLDLQDGAVLQLTNSALLLTLTNDHVNIDGRLQLDSGWINFGDTTVTGRVGRVTSGSLIVNAGTVYAGAVFVGGLTNSSGFIYLNGGVFNVSSVFSDGRNFGTTGTVAVAGGQLFATNGDSRVGDSGIGFMTVSNGTLVLTNFDVGRNALSVGTLALQAGGQITSLSDVSIGRFAGSTGSVLIAGGQLDASGQKIRVAREGDGQMTLSNGIVQAASVWVAADATNTANGILNLAGGNLSIASNLVVGAVSYSSGQVTNHGGVVTVTNSGGTAVIVVANGNLTLNSGAITTDSLWLTNATGQFIFNGGTLTTKNTAVTNGAAFVVGNGVTPATLYLDGGIHAFANGLVISSNATLAGCGAILGPIINHGTLALNCGGTLVAPTISSLVKTGVTNHFSFVSVTNQTYTLEYKTNLTDATWTAIPPPLKGNGGVLLLVDPAATNAARFYHVHTQ